MPKITEMYAYVTDDTGPDDEGVIGMFSGREWVPFVGADMAMANKLRRAAQAIATVSGKQVRLLHFGGPPGVIETLEPGAGDEPHRGTDA